MSSASVTTCPKCGAAVAPSSPFCGLCGAPLAATGPATLRMTDMGRPILAVVLAFFGLGLCGPITAVPAMVIARKGLAEGASGVGAGTKMQLFQIAWWLAVVDLLVWVLVLLFLGAQYIPAWKRF